jgi:hypothetical protein
MSRGRTAIPRLALLLLLVVAAPAAAAEVSAAPKISGDSTVGVLLQASTGVWSPASAVPAYAWLRCTPGSGCTPIDGACGLRYRVGPNDLGHRLRIRLTVRDGTGPPASGVSRATPVVVTKPYALPGDREPDSCSTVTETGPQTGDFVSGIQPEPVTPAPVGSTATPFITPFPIVRVAGRFTRRWTTLTRVSVRAPRGVRIGLRCHGRGCRFKRRAMAARVVRVRSLQRRYRAGAVVEIRITQSGHIGKYMRLRARGGRAPLRIDRCLMPGSSRAVRCPSS